AGRPAARPTGRRREAPPAAARHGPGPGRRCSRTATTATGRPGLRPARRAGPCGLRRVGWEAGRGTQRSLRGPVQEVAIRRRTDGRKPASASETACGYWLMLAAYLDRKSVV